jgi:hypothetical protein
MLGATSIIAGIIIVIITGTGEQRISLLQRFPAILNLDRHRRA